MNMIIIITINLQLNFKTSSRTKVSLRLLLVIINILFKVPVSSLTESPNIMFVYCIEGILFQLVGPTQTLGSNNNRTKQLINASLKVFKV